MEVDAHLEFFRLVTSAPGTKKAEAVASAFLDGRDLHTLLELFKYITENPEPSERLLEKLRSTNPARKSALAVEQLIF